MDKSSAQSPGNAREGIWTLVEEIDRYLARMPGPGIAEVRSGIARAHGKAVQPKIVSSNAVVETHLPSALGILSGTHSELASAIGGALPWLRWVNYSAYPLDEIGEGFASNHAFASILGDGSLIDAHDFSLGLFLISPHVLYRDHSHPAPELYAPLTGPHGWRFQPNGQLSMLDAHQPVWNEPNQSHLTKVGSTPFLCIYCWTKDVDESAVVRHASDWAELEELQLN